MSGTHLSIPTICEVGYVGSAVKNHANAGTVGLMPGSGRSRRRHGNSLSILAWNIHGQGVLLGYSHGVLKSRIA